MKKVDTKYSVVYPRDLADALKAHQITAANLIAVGISVVPERSAQADVHLVYAETGLKADEQVQLEGAFIEGYSYLSTITQTPQGLCAEGTRGLNKKREFAEVVHTIAETLLGTVDELFLVAPANTPVVTWARTASGIWTEMFAPDFDARHLRMLTDQKGNTVGYIVARGKSLYFIKPETLSRVFSGGQIGPESISALKLIGTARGDFTSAIVAIGRPNNGILIVTLQSSEQEIVSLCATNPQNLTAQVLMAVHADGFVIGNTAGLSLLATVKPTDTGFAVDFIPTGDPQMKGQFGAYINA